MKYGGLVVEKKEYELIKKMTLNETNANDHGQKVSIGKLITELKSAKFLPSKEMPIDTVRLNSTVTFIIADLFKKRFKIVAPEHSDVTKNKLSILSPMGLALFGYSENDVVEWQFPSGPNTVKIIKVEQEN